MNQDGMIAIITGPIDEKPKHIASSSVILDEGGNIYD